MTTPTRQALKQGLVVDIKVGETLTLYPTGETKTIVVRLLEKTGRLARLRVQSTEAVQATKGQEDIALSR